MAGIKRQADSFQYPYDHHQSATNQSVKRSRPNGWHAVTPARPERQLFSKQTGLFDRIKSVVTSFWSLDLRGSDAGKSQRTASGLVRQISTPRRLDSLRLQPAFPAHTHTHTQRQLPTATTLAQSITMNGRPGESSKSRATGGARRAQEVIDLSREDEGEGESEDPLLLTPQTAEEMHQRNQSIVTSQAQTIASGSRIRRDGSAMTISAERAPRRREWGQQAEAQIEQLRHHSRGRGTEVIEVVDSESEDDVKPVNRPAHRRKQKQKKPLDQLVKQLEIAEAELERATDLDSRRELGVTIDSLSNEIGRRRREEAQRRPSVFASTQESFNLARPEDDVHAYRKLLLQRTTPRTDDFLAKPSSRVKPFEPAIRKAVVPQKYVEPKDITEILNRLEKARIEQEKEAERLTKPRIPDALSPEEKQIVSDTLRNPRFTPPEVGNESVESRNMTRMKPGQWLSDDLINYYMAMISKRNQSDAKLPKIHHFNSFFYTKLSGPGQGYKTIRRWTKKVDIFSKDLVLMPINIGNMHWIAAAINFKHKRFEYFDSMGDYGSTMTSVFDHLAMYLDAEHRDKKGGVGYDTDDWARKHNRAAPRQNNGSDCGVFSCQTLELVARGADPVDKGFEFSSANMPFFRQLMIYEMTNGELKKRW